MFVLHKHTCLTDVPDPSKVMAFIILNNFKQIVKTWRKNLGDDVLYAQLKTAMSVV